MLRVIIPFLLLFTYSSNATTDHGAHIVWAVGHNPPRVSIDENGLLSGQGGIQQHILQAGLSQYTHSHEVTSFRQFFEDVKDEKNICSSFLFKTKEREEIMHFSLPWHIDLPPRVIIRKEIYEQLGRPQSMSLKTLLESQGVSGAVQKSRSFAGLDKIIESVSESNLERLEVPIPHFIDMLNAGRIDFTIAYSHLVNYIQKNKGLPFGNLVHVPIEEEFEFAFTYVGCPKNQWGKEVIEAINPVIKSERQKGSYLNLLKMLHQSQINRAIIDKIYHQHFVQSQ